MKVGINGMGRIGRLALRAAMGAAERPEDDPRGSNRLDVVHVNELKGELSQRHTYSHSIPSKANGKQTFTQMEMRPF